MKLKDIYDQEYVTALVGAIQSVYHAFDGGRFARRVFDQGWDARELKARMRHLAVTLRDFLPPDYRSSLDILRQAFPLLNNYRFQNLAFCDFVALYGLDDWEASIPALAQFTQEISAEFAVRHFIVRNQDRMMAQMLEWAQSDNVHWRRLASEGCRPLLPWGIRLPSLRADPAPILPILEQLKQDPSESVRKSVANNLNDISKDNPEVVLDVARRWQAHDTEEMRWMIGHALRTLVKAGRVEALELLGYPVEPAIALHNLSVEPQTVPWSSEVTLSFDIESLGDAPQNLMIDFVLYLMRAKGKQTPKVFKLTKRTIQPGEVMTISHRFSFRPVTTRKYYPGEHAIEPQINGQVFGRAEFVLSKD